jgi:hypothetical protein
MRGFANNYLSIYKNRIGMIAVDRLVCFGCIPISDPDPVVAPNSGA